MVPPFISAGRRARVFRHVRKKHIHTHTHLLYLVNPAALHDVVIDHDVLAVELHLLLHVSEEPSDLGREVDDPGGLVPLEDRVHGRPDAEVAVGAREEHPRLVGGAGRVGGHEGLEGGAHEARAAGDEDGDGGRHGD